MKLYLNRTIEINHENTFNISFTGVFTREELETILNNKKIENLNENAQAEYIEVALIK